MPASSIVSVKRRPLTDKERELLKLASTIGVVSDFWFGVSREAVYRNPEGVRQWEQRLEPLRELGMLDVLETELAIYYRVKLDDEAAPPLPESHAAVSGEPESKPQPPRYWGDPGEASDYDLDYEDDDDPANEDDDDDPGGG